MYNLEFKTSRHPFWMHNAAADKELEKFFTNFAKNETCYTPVCEIVEQEKFFAISIDMPGMKKDDINLEVKDAQLYITGERKKTASTASESVLKSEKVYGKFARVFTIPQNVNTDAIDAKFDNGVLEVFLPKEEKALAKKITISERKDSSLNN